MKKKNRINNKIEKMELINEIRNMINNKIKKMVLINEIKNKIKKMGLINDIKNMIKECDYDNYQGERGIRGVLWMAQF